MGTKSDPFSVYFRVNVSNVLSNERFIANKEKAKVRLTLAIDEGSATNDTTVTLKTYDPNNAVTNIAFAILRWLLRKTPLSQHLRLRLF